MFKIFFLVLLINTLAFSKVLNASSSLKIIDGDTIILNSEKIRFYGIDTPEKNKHVLIIMENHIRVELEQL